MFKITIEGDNLSDLASNLLTMAAQFQTTVPEELPTGKPKATKTKATKPAPEPEEDPLGDGNDEDGLLAPAEPMPETGKAIVDGGTGQPIPKADAAPLKMTFDDVKVAAAKLVAKDQSKLAAILRKYSAANLSAVPKDQLGDFASDVMEALDS